MLNPHRLKLTTLTPFNYGHLAVNGGVATVAQVIGDRAISFALCAALGMMRASCKLPDKDYRSHIAAMPWRASVFVADDPSLLPPIARRSDLGVEGGYPDRVARAAKSGNFKEFFTIQEVPHGKTFRGAVFGTDPFEIAGCESFVARIGSNRTGMVLIERDQGDDKTEDIVLNAATAALFGKTLPVSRYLLHEMQLTAPRDIRTAAEEASSWA